MLNKALMTNRRLVYNWVMVDLELSLFHDTTPVLSISELLCPLPGPEMLWMASNSEQWLAAVQSAYGCTTNVSPHLLTNPSLTPSLCDLFQDFLHDNLSRRQGGLAPQQMRLLLHPLQSLLCHLRQMLSCFSDILGGSRRSNPSTANTGRPPGVTKASTHQRLEEVQALLQKWYELAVTMVKNDPLCPVTTCNLILYHLISLNAVTNFPEIERLARKEGFEDTSRPAGGSGVTPTPSYWELGLRHKRCIYQREEAIFHCGQVLRLLRSLPADRQPSWWSAAVYRVTLILWTDGVGRSDPSFNTAACAKAKESGASPSGIVVGATGGSSSTPGKVAVDQVTPEDPAVIQYLWGGDGVAVLTRGDVSGGLVSLDQPAEVLALGIKIIEGGVSTRIGDGIRRKLGTLASNWSLDSFGGGHAVSA